MALLFLSLKNVVQRMIYFWLCLRSFSAVSFLAYGLEEQKNLTNCRSGAFHEQKGPEYTSCQFPLVLLEACSGVNDPEFGYSTGSPCILVKMNRVCT